MTEQIEKVELPAGKQPALRVVPMATDTNYYGHIFGGWIMAQIDIAGSIPALAFSRGRIATIAVNSMEFHKPVMVGDLVSFYAEVVQTGRSSITVDVEVYAQRNAVNPETIKVTRARLTYVALDEERKPRDISHLAIEN